MINNMRSPKYTFYLSKYTDTIAFDKSMFLSEDNKIKWSEIHITQFAIEPGYKYMLIPFIGKYSKIDDYIRGYDYNTSITLNIENFNENIDEKSNNYTLNILDIEKPYSYDKMYASKIVDPTKFTVNGDKVIFKIAMLKDNEPFSKHDWPDDKYRDDENPNILFHIELFFK
jgi:hypothetical protein